MTTWFQNTLLVSLITLSSIAYAAEIPVQLNQSGDDHTCAKNSSSFCVEVKPGEGITAGMHIKFFTQFDIKIEHEGMQSELSQQFKTGWGVSDAMDSIPLLTLNPSVPNDTYYFNLALLEVNGTTPAHCQVNFSGKGSIYPGQIVTLILNQHDGVFSCS